MSGSTYSWTGASGTNASWSTSSDWTTVAGPGGSYPQSTDTAEIGAFSAATTIFVTGAQAAAAVSISGTHAFLSMGSSTAQGTLTVGGTTSIGGGSEIIIATAASSSELITNALTISGSTTDELFQQAGTISVGSGGVGMADPSGNLILDGGVFDITNGGGLTVTSGAFTDATATSISGTASFNGGTNKLGYIGIATNLGSLAVGSAKLTLEGGTIAASTGISDSGTIVASNSAVATSTRTVLQGVIAGSGTIEAGTAAGGSTLELTSAVTSTSTTFDIDNTTTASVLQFDSSVASGVNVTFLGTSTGVLKLNDFTTGSPDSLNFAGTIKNMGSASTEGGGDMINVQGAAVTGVTDTGTSGTLKISDATGVITTITMSSGATAKATFAKDTTGLGGYDIWLVCYAAGTRIETPNGDVAVEDLSEGDLVITLDDDRRVPMPVKWIGHRRLDLASHPRPEMVAPVRIRCGAFAANLPRRDLVVSPDHCVFVDRKLIPAKLLINDMTIVQERAARAVTYYHVELDRHAVLLAEGLPAESYLDTGNRAFFSNAGLALVLHPEFHVNAGLRCWEIDACAPLAIGSEAVEPVWRSLAGRAETLGYIAPQVTTTYEANLHLSANGRPIRSTSVENNCHLFVLPPNTTAVRLASRADAPSDLVPYLEDWRRLGVAVTRIVVRDGDEQMELAADHPAFMQGWHSVEHDGSVLWRWTDGNAVLPIPLRAGPLTVEIHVHQTRTYRIFAEEPARLVA